MRTYEFGLRVASTYFIMMVLAACGRDEGAGVATLSWTPPGKNVDGSPLEDLAAYHILYGRSPDDLSYSMRVDDPAVRSVVIGNLDSGVWYFTVVAVNSRGKVSERSEIVSKTIP